MSEDLFGPSGGPDTPEHEPSLYEYERGCRCADCRAFKAERSRIEREKRIALMRAGSDRVPHGTESGSINWGCNCKRCYRARELAFARRVIAKYEGEL